MLKKIIIIAGFAILLTFSFILLLKTEQTSPATPDDSSVMVKEDVLPDTVYSFNMDSINATCSETRSDYCAVETAVKCTINPSLEICKSANLPEFIFIKDPTVERPTEINYRFTNKKVLPNGTTEFYTESSCNGRWFGLCQGTVIYVVNTGDDKVYIKDIYAIEEE